MKFATLLLQMRFATLLLLILAFTRTAGAQTLEECIALARRNAPALQAADATVIRAEQAIREARAALAPTMGLDASLVQNSEANRVAFPLPGAPSSFKVGSATVLDVRAQARLKVYSGGRDGALVNAAKAARTGQQHGRDQADADLVLRVSQSYYRALAARRLEAAASDALVSARGHLRTSAARVRAGAVSRLDSLQAQVDLARRNAAEIRAAEAVRLARVDLETAIGASLGSGDGLVEPGAPFTALPETQTAVDQAIHARPELAAFDAQLRESEFQLQAARGARQPQVTLGATAQYLGPNRDEDYWDADHPGLRTYKLFASVGLTMPLFDGGLVAARAGQVAAQHEELVAQRRQTELDVRGEVEHALADARVAHTVWQSDSSRVAAAREALRIAEAGYKGGTTTSTDVRDAVAALADARAEEAQSLMDYWTARAALDHATGATAKKED